MAASSDVDLAEPAAVRDPVDDVPRAASSPWNSAASVERVDVHRIPSDGAATGKDADLGLELPCTVQSVPTCRIRTNGSRIPRHRNEVSGLRPSAAGSAW